ncbi:MAG: hypothetical protein COB54_01405 [Alphaproteobacteria bacterium]|nr:MAG: hypothetical protein COB54_01405 [Alphaproteobacteria bacterium]
MSRLFLIFLGSVIFLMPPLTFAEEAVSKKSQVAHLFKNYNTHLKAGKYEESLGFAEQIYGLTPEVFGKASRTHAAATFNVAYVNELLMDYRRAIKYYKEYFDVLDEMSVPKDKKYLLKLGFLSNVLMEHNKFSDGVKYALKELSLAKKINLSDEDIGDYELKVGRYYYRIRGKDHVALGYFNTAYDLLVESFGVDNLKVAEAAYWQGIYYKNRKKHALAIAKFDYILDIYKRDLAPDDPQIKLVYNSLADVYYKMGQKEKAYEYTHLAINPQSDGVNSAVRPILKVAPIYPSKALRNKFTGYVIFEFTVNKAGRVEDVKAIGGQRIKLFEKSARKALFKFKYIPAYQDGKPVATKGVRELLSFSME